MNKEIVFGAGAMITPDLAAAIAQCASKYDANVSLQYKGAELCVDSLIGILSMSIHDGSKVVVKAEGADAVQALDDVCSILNGAK